MTPDEARTLRCGNRVILWRGFGFSYGNVEKVTDYGFEVLWDRSQQTSSYTLTRHRTDSAAPSQFRQSLRTNPAVLNALRAAPPGVPVPARQYGIPDVAAWPLPF